MSEEANPVQPGATEAPVSSSVDDKMAALFGLDEPKQETQEAAPEAQTPTDGDPDADLELEVPADDQPQTDEWIEITRHGEKKRLSKEDAIKFASKGFDYEANVERLKGEEAIIKQYKQALEAKGKITPQVIEARANVVAYERALAPYASVEWQKLANEDPIAYTQHRAQFDSLRDGYGQASQQFQQALGAAQQVDSVITEAELAQQQARLFELHPDLRNQETMKAEQGRMIQFLKEIGADEGSFHMVSRSADAFAIVRDAMRYRNAVKARAERVKTAPTVKPGAAPQRSNPQARKAEAIKAVHQAKTPDSKKAALDQALAIKFGLM